MKYNIGALVQYAQCISLTYSKRPQSYPDIGVVTEVDEFGDHRVVWTSGGVGWYTSAELEPFNKQETK